MQYPTPLSAQELSHLPPGWGADVAKELASLMPDGKCSENWARKLAKADPVTTLNQARAIGFARKVIALHMQSLAEASELAAKVA